MSVKFQSVLVSVADKRGVVELCQRLKADVGLFIASSGTAGLLRSAGLAVAEVGELGALPEMLDGRVKTLQPQIHAGILARRDADHLGQLARHDIAPIDVVIANLYPFEQTVARADVTWDAAIENIDIGGVALIRGAAKNHEHVAVLVDPDDYSAFVEANSRNEVDAAFRRRLARKAFSRTAAYDRAIESFLQEEDCSTEVLPRNLHLGLELAEASRYGENPHQQGALYSPCGAAPPFERLHGKPMSYNNWLDLDAAWQVIQMFSEPTVAIIKHGNPCGVASGGTLAEAYENALASDPISAFGSVIACNQEVDEEAARPLSKLFVEVLAAPSFAPSAKDLLSRKKNVRLLNPSGQASSTLRLRSIWGGYLVQEQDRESPDLDPQSWTCATERQPTPAQLEELSFVWRVAKHVKSNAIVFGKGTATVGIGAGQMSRLDSVHLAARKAGKRSRDSAMASDAFFPFPDGIEEAARAGVTSVVQPGGSMRDKSVVEAADRLGLCMMFTGHRHFLH